MFRQIDLMFNNDIVNPVWYAISMARLNAQPTAYKRKPHAKRIEKMGTMQAFPSYFA